MIGVQEMLKRLEKLEEKRLKLDEEMGNKTNYEIGEKIICFFVLKK